MYTALFSRPMNVYAARNCIGDLQPSNRVCFLCRFDNRSSICCGVVGRRMVGRGVAEPFGLAV